MDIEIRKVPFMDTELIAARDKEGNRNITGASEGTEELAHLEMVGTIVYQLTRNLTPEQIQEAGFSDYFVDHTTGVYPQAASGTPFSAATFAVTGDPIADLNEDLAADATIAKEQLATKL